MYTIGLSHLAAGDAVSLSNMTALERMEHLREQGVHIYLCFQSIQKMQPHFDHVLLDILIADPRGHIVLQASRHSMQTETLQRRLDATMRERLCGDEFRECPAWLRGRSRIHFLPRVKSDDLFGLLRKASVILHPFPFGGSKTASDAINAVVPLVTFPQKHLRGRMAATFIRAMDLGEVDPDAAACCIADSLSDYAAKAMRLASDLAYRSRVVHAIRERRHRMFGDKMIAVEWGLLLTRALGLPMREEQIRSYVGFVPESRHKNAYISRVFEDEQSRWIRGVRRQR